MDGRISRGLQIAKTATIYEGVDGWLVPSQTNNKRYLVGKDFSCTCPDHRGRGCKCKHAYAVEFYLQRITRNRDGSVEVETKRVTYPQAWAIYDKSQQEEKAQFMQLLKGLTEMIEEPAYKFGRPRTSKQDLIFSSALKVYSQFSLRRFMSDLKQAKENGLVKSTPCFASIGHFMQKPELTPALHRLIALSSLALNSVETIFAVDSSGFRTTKFSDYCRHKHKIRKQHKWLKAHICCGVKTNIITSVQITSEYGADVVQFKPLIEATASNGFDIQEASADKAYSSRDNLGLIDSMGGVAYIPFRKNTTGRPKGKAHAWRKMFHYFKYNQEEFAKHYHLRSNAETTFFMVKAKFNDLLKSKTHIAQVNEVLLKVLCHNIVVVAHETNELGLKTNFN